MRTIRQKSLEFCCRINCCWYSGCYSYIFPLISGLSGSVVVMTYTCQILDTDMVPVTCFYECEMADLNHCLTQYQPACCAVEKRGKDNEKLLQVQCNSCDLEKGQGNEDFYPAQKLKYKHINMTEVRDSHTSAAVIMMGEDNSTCPKVQCAIPLSFFSGIMFVAVIVCLAKNACRDGPGQAGKWDKPS